jgi:FSR family fosmidomycin resistance protein-like MFS transporter
MTTDSLPVTQLKDAQFQTGQVLPVAAAHFIHDIFTSFFPPLLPALIEKLSLSLVQVGSLNAILQIGSLLNPLLGYLADNVNMRMFVIFAPAVTATLMSLIGAAPSYYALAAILFVSGFSVAAFHAPAPAMIGRVAGRKIGLGMSLFMAAGEMSRTLGPLLAVWAVSLWGLEGVTRLMVLGWAASLILFLRLREVSARLAKPGSLRSVVPMLRSFFLPLAIVNLLRYFLSECLTTYLPTFLNQQGLALTQAGMALSLLEFAGVGGALLSGTLSDHLGRRSVLMVAILAPAALIPVFLNLSGWWLVPILLLLGFTSLSSTPVMLAMVQDHMPNNRAVGNGLFMVLSFILRSIATLSVGAMGDRIGLHQVFYWSALLSCLAVPAILALPNAPQPVETPS